jgi:hypothetical protein
MKRLVLLLTLLLTAVVCADSSSPLTITTRAGKSFYECKVTRVDADGIAFTHRDGVVKIAFKDLPESLRQQFRHDPKKAAAQQRAQDMRHQEELEREAMRETVMAKKLQEAQQAEASYLAAANAAALAPVSSPMSLALPGESLPTVGQQAPSWLGAPITGPALGGRDYRQSSFSYWGGYPFVNSFGGGYYPMSGYGYPYGGFGCGYAPAGVYVSPTIYHSWNVGGGFRIGVGINPFGGAIRVFP